MAWRRVYSNHPTGDAFSGSKEELMDAVRRGASIKVGFPGSRDGDIKITAAETTGIMDGEVIAQFSVMTMKGDIPSASRMIAYRLSTSGKVELRNLFGDAKITDGTIRRALVWYADA